MNPLKELAKAAFSIACTVKAVLAARNPIKRGANVSAEVNLHDHALRQLYRVIDQNPPAARKVVACMGKVRAIDYEIASREIVDHCAMDKHVQKTLGEMRTAIDANPAIAQAALESLQLLENAIIQNIRLCAMRQVKDQGQEELLEQIHNNAGRPNDVEEGEHE